MAELKYDWLIRFFFDVLLIFIFLFIFLYPLWKLSKTRPAMIIVFSRAIGIGSSFLLLTEMPSFLINYILCVSPPLVIYLLSANRFVNDTVLVTHILALAVNRAHAMIFPFHYNWFSAKKMNFYLICALLWLFSLIVGSLDLLRRWTPATETLFSVIVILKICIGIAAFCYSAITCKMIWLKYKRNSTLSSHASSEKDSVRILIVCFSCLLVSSLRYFVLPTFNKYITADGPKIAKIIYTWITYFTNLFYICTEEICLLFLVRDFRKDVKQQFRHIFCYFTKNSSSSNNTNNITTFSSTNIGIRVNNWTQKN